MSILRGRADPKMSALPFGKSAFRRSVGLADVFPVLLGDPLGIHVVERVIFHLHHLFSFLLKSGPPHTLERFEGQPPHDDTSQHRMLDKNKPDACGNRRDYCHCIFHSVLSFLCQPHAFGYAAASSNGGMTTASLTPSTVSTALSFGNKTTEKPRTRSPTTLPNASS